MRLEEKLAALRREHKMTQAELAEALDVSRQAVSKWERGVAVPSMENLVCMGRLFGVPVEQLVDDNLALKKKPVELEAAAEPQPDRRGGRVALTVVLAACLLLSAIASVITIVSAIVKEPEEPQDGITWLDDMETEDIVLPEVQDWTDGITGVKP